MNNRPICAHMTTSSSARSSAMVRRTALAPPAPPTCRCSRFPHKQQCSAVTCASRLVTASNRTFSDGGGDGGDWCNISGIFVLQDCVGARAFYIFGPVCICFGVIPEEEVRTSQLVATDQRAEGTADAQPRASPKPINRAYTNSCMSRAPRTSSGTSAMFVHATVVAGTEAEVPCHAPGLPW
jgi:hypothetical protein